MWKRFTDHTHPAWPMQSARDTWTLRLHQKTHTKQGRNSSSRTTNLSKLGVLMGDDFVHIIARTYYDELAIVNNQISYLQYNEHTPFRFAGHANWRKELQDKKTIQFLRKPINFDPHHQCIPMVRTRTCRQALWNNIRMLLIRSQMTQTFNIRRSLHHDMMAFRIQMLTPCRPHRILSGLNSSFLIPRDQNRLLWYIGLSRSESSS